MAEKKINGRTYQVGVVLATEAVRLQVRLMKILGGGVERLPAILSSRRANASEAERAAGDAAAVAALADVFARCDPEDVTQLISDIVGMATLKGPSGSWERVDLDGVFTEHKADLLPVASFVLKEVLGDFFSGAMASGSLSKALRS